MTEMPYLCWAFLYTSTGVNSYVKELGFGLAVAILLDATVIRSVLVPAIMRVLGEANWWLPFRFAVPIHNRKNVETEEGLS
ncbi:MMPL family transporter [Geobacillus icigianus]|uniref:Membrane transport protein MMPL domain-containing protein n=1 Tax=Geobacillus icigianus TaxID=1430331 RepID=A0ABU6BI26_9BACL|nr:hypothetical protein [Geobacillus icigianus]